MRIDSKLVAAWPRLAELAIAMHWLYMAAAFWDNVMADLRETFLDVKLVVPGQVVAPPKSLASEQHLEEMLKWHQREWAAHFRLPWAPVVWVHGWGTKNVEIEFSVPPQFLPKRIEVVRS